MRVNGSVIVKNFVRNASFSHQILHSSADFFQENRIPVAFSRLLVWHFLIHDKRNVKQIHIFFKVIYVFDKDLMYYCK